MSARVVNPFSLNEMRRLREAVAARPPTYRPDPEARARVCRNLYGRASAEDSRSFVAKEMAEQRERAADRWGFDFFREAPRTHGPGADRYKWSRVKIGTVPAAYRMPRMAPLPAATATPLVQVLETARTTVPVLGAVPSTPEASATPIVSKAATPSMTPTVVDPGMVSPDLASPPCTTTSVAAPAPHVRQTTLKEYMLCRKRSSSSRKRADEDLKPAKRSRTESRTESWTESGPAQS